MTIRIEAGWQTSKIGALRVQVSSASIPITSAAITVTAGDYAHTSMVSVLGAGVYPDFASQLQTQLRARPNGTAFTVAYVGATGIYTIAHSGTFNLRFVPHGDSGTRLRRILGYSGEQTGAASYAGTIRPYYYVSGAMGGMSRVSGDYEPEGMVEGSFADDGSQYAVARQTAPTFLDFTIPFEASTATYTRFATAAIPWTYQHFWQHVRGDEPFLVVDDLASTVCFLRPEGGSFRPSREVEDYNGLWNHRFLTYVKGRL